MRSFSLLGALDRYLHRRDPAEEERRRQEMVERYGYDPETGGPPEMVTLQCVVAIGQLVRLSDSTLIMLSLESYAEGFLLNVRLLLDTEPEPSPVFGPPLERSFPKLRRLKARDDLGREYRLFRTGGGGGREWRWEFRSNSPLLPDARELVLEVPEIRWETFSPETGPPLTDRVESGPWQFTVAL